MVSLWNTCLGKDVILYLLKEYRYVVPDILDNQVPLLLGTVLVRNSHLEFLFKNFIGVYVYLDMCMWYRYPHRLEGTIGYPGTGVTGSYVS